MFSGECRHNLAPSSWGWHHLHAAAGLCFVLVLAPWARRQTAGEHGRASAPVALGGASLFVVANAGEVLTGVEVFVPLYGIGLLLLCLGLLAAGGSSSCLGPSR